MDTTSEITPLNRSVLRDWVMQLSLREQGTLIVALRGCDVASKIPLNSPERRLTAAIRYAVCVPADDREVDAKLGAFMTRVVPVDVRLGMLEHYPQHWVGHVIHACEVLGYREPDENTRQQWFTLYREFCRSLHLPPESFADMLARLTEDRIANDNVVTL